MLLFLKVYKYIRLEEFLRKVLSSVSMNDKESINSVLSHYHNLERHLNDIKTITYISLLLR